VGTNLDANTATGRRTHTNSEVVLSVLSDPLDSGLPPFDGSDDEPEGGFIAPERLVPDPWTERAARRAMGFVAIRRVRRRLLMIRVDPIPHHGAGRDLHWLCFGPQEEIDAWRYSNMHAELALRAVAGWLEGLFLTFGGALAASFPLPILQGTLLETLEPQPRRILAARVAGATLEELASAEQLSRERIRQIESGAAETLAFKIVVLRAVHHPLTLALFVHAKRLAETVLEQASQVDGNLTDMTKRAWIRRVLAGPEAEAMLLLLRLSEEVDADLQPTFDPLRMIGRPLAGGRTSLPWRDEDIEALTAGFAQTIAGRARRWAALDQVCQAARLPKEAALRLAPLARLSVRGDWIFEGRLRPGDSRREALFGILADADRAMHEAGTVACAIST